MAVSRILTVSLATLLLAGFFAALLPPALAAAQDSNVVLGNKETNIEVETLRRVNLARQIIQLGIEDKDPLALIIAARIFREIPPIEGPPPKKIGGYLASDRLAGDGKMSVVLDNSVGNLLAKAREYAEGRQDILGIIEDIAAMSARGAGGIVHIDIVPSKTTDIYEITYEGMKPAALYIEAQEDVDLDLEILDGQGNNICSDSGTGVTSYCEWMPKKTDAFVIKVMNKGSLEVDYILLTN